MATDTTGWNVYTDDNDNETNVFRGDFRLKKAVGTSIKNINAIVLTNKGSGNYNVYEDNGLLEGLGTELYNYTASSAKKVIENQDAFDSIFTGRNASQFTNLDKITKKATLALAKNTIGTNDPQNLANYTRLINTKGFKSLGANAASISLNDMNNDLRNDQSVPVNTAGVSAPNKVQAQSFSVGGTKQVLRYPRQSLEQFGYDYIQITAFDYEPSGMGSASAASLGGGKGEGKASGFSGPNPRFKNQFETIQLPMQPGLQEAMGVDWGQDKLNAMKMTMANAASAGIDSVSAQLGGPVNIPEQMAAGKNMAGVLRDIGGKATDPGTAKFVKAWFAGQAVGSQSVTARTTGTVINPNLELLFGGPQLRQFNFNFNLTPRDREEARIVRKIVRAMKRNMAPQRSESGLFLKTPRIFKIEYIYGEGNTEQPFMNKFKPCACQNFAVNYTPDGSYMTYAGEPSMTSYQISMSFGEIEPIYADEYGGKGGVDEDQTMGF